MNVKYLILVLFSLKYSYKLYNEEEHDWKLKFKSLIFQDLLVIFNCVTDKNNHDDLTLNKSNNIIIVNQSKNSFLIKKPMTPEFAIQNLKDKLSSFEHVEIFNFKEIYFIGSEANKIDGQVGILNNQGYDDEKGNYKAILHDHISYRYEIIEKLGNGNFAQVFKCFDHKLGKNVALKIIINNIEIERAFQEEIRILKDLQKVTENDANNLIKMYESFKFRNHICITFEILSINLFGLIKENNYFGLSSQLVRNLTRSMLKSLVLLSKFNITHSDLKPENVLLKKKGESDVKLVDFGLSFYENQPIFEYFQTSFYTAPEIILRNKFGIPIDMWSLGCIVAELLIGYPLFQGNDESDQMACIIELIGIPPTKLLNKSKRKLDFFSHKGYPRYCKLVTLANGSNVLQTVKSKHGTMRGLPGSKDFKTALKGHDDPVLIDFLKKCLNWDQHARITPFEALNHPWFKI